MIQEGILQEGDNIEVVQKGLHQISLFEANEAYKNPLEHKALLEKILNIPYLAESYHESIKKRLRGEADFGYMEINTNE